MALLTAGGIVLTLLAGFVGGMAAMYIILENG